MRLLILLLVSLGIGTGICYLIPQWQRLLLIPGELHTVTAGSPYVDITLEDPEKPKMYYMVEEAAPAFFAAGKFSVGPNLRLHGSSANGSGGRVTWTVSEGKHTSTRWAPGLHLDLRATVEALGTAPEGEIAEVTWSSEPLLEYARKSHVVARNGRAHWVDDHFLLARLPIFPTAAARQRKILLYSAENGLPFALAALVVLIASVAMRSPAGETAAITSEDRILFPRYFYGARLYFCIWCSVVALVPSAIAGVTLFDADQVDVTENTYFSYGAGAIGLALIIVIGWLTLLNLREVEADPEMLTVRTGPFRRPKIQAAWSDLLPAEARTVYYKGRISDEYVLVRTSDGNKVRIGRNYVRDFKKMRDFLVKRTTASA